MKPEDQNLHANAENNSIKSEDYNNQITIPKGNIIDQLRHKVRAEAARTFRNQGQSARERSVSGEDFPSPSICSTRVNGGVLMRIESVEGDAGIDEEHLNAASALSSAVTSTWLDGQDMQEELDETLHKPLDLGDQKYVLLFACARRSG